MKSWRYIGSDPPCQKADSKSKDSVSPSLAQLNEALDRMDEEDQYMDLCTNYK